MYRSTTRWTTAVAAAALIALPVAAAAQSSGTTPPQQPPAQTQPQTQPPPMQPAPQQPTTPAQPGGQVDQVAAKQHLTQARDTLSQITSMPEASKLQGDARNQVSQLIANFNELITTQANWRASYDKVNSNLTSLIGPDATDPNAATGTAGAVGTSGTAGTAGTAGTSGTTNPAAAPATVDPAIKAKLAEFRTHLKAFEQAAGGGNAAEPSGAMPPAAATDATSNPANPATAATGAAGANPPAMTGAQPPTTAGATGTSGATGATAEQPKAAEAAGHAEADKHLDAIDAILAKSKTGTLTKAQTTELKKHVEELRKLLQSQR
jgi:hypothetical protein